MILRAQAGDDAAVGSLLEHYRNYLRSIANSHMAVGLRRRMDASDLVQQTLMEAHSGIDALLQGDEDHLRMALRQILRCNIANAIRDHLVAQKRAAGREKQLGSKMEIEADQSSPSIHLHRYERAERFLRALEALPADQADAVRMRYLDGASVGAIAESLNRSRSAAAGLLKRGLQALRSQLQGESSLWT